MTRAAIVTTTINVPVLLEKWIPTLTPDDIVIVVGDERSPHVAIEKFLDTLNVETEYLRPAAQEHWASSRVIGWRTIARRNIGILHAMLMQPRFITMIDDDNYPLVPESYLSDIERYFNKRGSDYVSTNYRGYINPCEYVYDELLFHRGYPRDKREIIEHGLVETNNVKIGVFESLWSGNPDIDAIDRIHDDDDHYPTDDYCVIPDLGVWSPFNSQATSYITELAPLMMVWPGVGRADDIWSSYTARCVMDNLGYYAMHGAPFVIHERDAYGNRSFQTHLRDMKNEMMCYEFTDNILNVLRNATRYIPSGDLRKDVPIILRHIYSHITTHCGFLPTQTYTSFSAWLSDIETVSEVLES